MSQTRMSAKNTFGSGLIMDFAPDNTLANCLTNALNATFLTFNGNEMSLQNDMGNGRVESAFLPEGYIPVGTCEFGDIIYIVSYNPLINKSQIGCFPSPERNISNREINLLESSISGAEFAQNGVIKSNTVKKIIFGGNNIGPGDKFIISWGSTGAENQPFISNFGNTKHSLKNDEGYWPKVLKINVVSIEDSGKITYLSDDVCWYNTDTEGKRDGDFIISSEQFLDEETGDVSEDLHNLDEYRHALQCLYSVFLSKVSGKLALLLELEAINNFNCGHKVFKRYEVTDGVIGESSEYYDIYFSTSWETDNYNINPCGMLITDCSFNNMALLTDDKDGDNKYFTVEDNNKYDPKRVIEFSRIYELEKSPNTYNEFLDMSYYTKISKYLKFLYDKSNLALNSQISLSYGESQSTVEVKDVTTIVNQNTLSPKRSRAISSGENSLEKPSLGTASISSKYSKDRQLVKFIIRAYDKKEDNVKIPAVRPDGKLYIPNPEFLKNTESETKYYTTIEGVKVECPPLIIPDDVIVNTFKKSVLTKIGTVKKAQLLTSSENENLNFSITYTVCPCMPYGPLEHLAVTNTINFNKEQNGNVDLSMWKYYVNANSLTLNFGFDTYLREDLGEIIDKVLMEFYDNLGICATYELTNLESYDGKFTEYIELDLPPSNYKFTGNKLKENSIDRTLSEPIIHAGDYLGNLLLDIAEKDLPNFVYLSESGKFESAKDLKAKTSAPASQMMKAANNPRNQENPFSYEVEQGTCQEVSICAPQPEVFAEDFIERKWGVLRSAIKKGSISHLSLTPIGNNKYKIGGILDDDKQPLYISHIKNSNGIEFASPYNKFLEEYGGLSVGGEYVLYIINAKDEYYTYYAFSIVYTTKENSLGMSDYAYILDFENEKIEISCNIRGADDAKLSIVNIRNNISYKSVLNNQYIFEVNKLPQGNYDVEIIASNSSCTNSKLTAKLKVEDWENSNPTPIITITPIGGNYSESQTVKVTVDKNNYPNDIDITTVLRGDSLEQKWYDEDEDIKINIPNSGTLTVKVYDYDNGKLLAERSETYTINLEEVIPETPPDLQLYPNDAGILYYGRPYFVKIKIYKGILDELGNIDTTLYTEPIEDFRWLWTAPVFNGYYTNIDDFKNCQLQANLDFSAELDGTILHSSGGKTSEYVTPNINDAISNPLNRIGANVVKVNPDGGDNIVFSGIPTLSESYGNSLFLDNSINKYLTVTMGIANPRIEVPETLVVYEEVQGSDISELHPLITEEINLDIDWKIDLTTNEDLLTAKDNFSLKFAEKNYKSDTSTKIYSYYDRSGRNIENECKVFTIKADAWKSHQDPTKKNTNEDVSPRLILAGIKYNKVSAGSVSLTESRKLVVPLLRTTNDLDLYGMKLVEQGDDKGLPYYPKIPYLGFSEKKGSGTKTKITTGYLEFNGDPDVNSESYPTLYINFSAFTDGNPLKVNLQWDTFINRLHPNILQTPISLIILGRGKIVENWADGIDCFDIRSNPSYLKSVMGTTKLGGGNAVTRYMTGLRHFYPYPGNLGYFAELSNKDGEIILTFKQDPGQYLKSVDSNAENGYWEQTEEKKAPFKMVPIGKNNYENDLYTALVIQTPEGPQIIGDAGLLKVWNINPGYKENNVENEDSTISNTLKFNWKEGKDIGKPKNYALAVASLLALLYVVIDDDQSGYVFNNIIKLKDFSESWNADLLVELNYDLPEDYQSSTFIKIIPKNIIMGDTTYNGISLYTYAVAAQMLAGYTPVTEEPTSAPRADIEILHDNNINPEFSDILRCVEFLYDLEYDLGGIISEHYKNKGLDLVYELNIYANASGETEILYSPVSLVLQRDTLYVNTGGRFEEYTNGSRFKLIDKFVVKPTNTVTSSLDLEGQESGNSGSKEGLLLGVIGEGNSVKKLDINPYSNLCKALKCSGNYININKPEELQQYDSTYTFVTCTHGDDPELRDLKRTHIFNFGRLS